MGRGSYSDIKSILGYWQNLKLPAQQQHALESNSLPNTISAESGSEEMILQLWAQTRYIVFDAPSTEFYELRFKNLYHHLARGHPFIVSRVNQDIATHLT